LLELFEVGDEPLPPLGTEPAQRLRPAVLETLPDFDEPGLAQHVEVAAQVSVRERAQPLQLGEQDALGSRDERRHDPEPRLFVQHAVEALVREPSGHVLRPDLLFRHG